MKYGVYGVNHSEIFENSITLHLVKFYKKLAVSTVTFTQKFILQ